MEKLVFRDFILDPYVKVIQNYELGGLRSTLGRGVMLDPNTSQAYNPV